MASCPDKIRSPWADLTVLEISSEDEIKKEIKPYCDKFLVSSSIHYKAIGI